MPLYSAPMSCTGAQLMILTLLVGLFLMRESRLAPVDALDEGFADFLAMNSRRTEEPAAVTLVGIDEATLKEHPLPWTPLDYALFFQSAGGFRPEIVATDAVLAWDGKALSPDLQTKYAQYETILREHLLRSSKVLLGARLGFPEDPDQPPVPESVPVLRHVKGELAAVPDFPAIEVQAGEDYRLSAATGFTNLTGVSNWHRSVPLLFRFRGQVVPSFVLQAVLMWEKLSLDDVSVELGSKIVLGDRVDIPIDIAGRMRVDFGVPRGHCGFDELVLSAAQAEAKSETQVPADAFTGKLLLLSRTDPESRNLGLAAGRSGSVGELFAAAIATVQSRTFIRRAPIWVDPTLIGLAMLASLWLPRWRKGRVAICGGVVLLAYVLTALWIFGSELVWLPIMLPTGLVFFVAVYRLATPGTEGELPKAIKIV
jgi:CHASE2 domain